MDAAQPMAPQSQAHFGVCETLNVHCLGCTTSLLALPCPWQSLLASMSRSLAVGATQQGPHKPCRSSCTICNQLLRHWQRGLYFSPSLNSPMCLKTSFPPFPASPKASFAKHIPLKHFLFHHAWFKGQPRASCRQPTAPAAKSPCAPIPVPQSLSPPQDGFTPS